MEILNSMTAAQWVINSLFLLLLLDVILTSFVITKQKTSKVLSMFGKYHKATTPGLLMKLPWPIVMVEDIVPLNIQELKGDVTVKSSDNAFLTIPWALQFQVMKDKVKEAYYELDDAEEQIRSYILNTVRGESAKMTMDELFKSNQSFEAAVDNTLSEKFEAYGYSIINVLVDDPQPSKEMKKAFDEVIASKRKKEAAQNYADATKIQMVGEAQAEGESLEIKGKSFKKFRMDIADGNADAIKKFTNGDASLSSKDVLDFFSGVDLRDAIRDSSKNPGNMIIVPVDFGNNITLPAIGMPLIEEISI